MHDTISAGHPAPRTRTILTTQQPTHAQSSRLTTKQPDTGTFLARGMVDANNNLRVVSFTVGLSGESDVLVNAHVQAEKDLLPSGFLDRPGSLTVIDGGKSLANVDGHTVRRALQE